MADSQFSVLFGEFRWAGINVRPAKHGGGMYGGRRRRIDLHNDSLDFGVAVAIWSRFHLPCRGDIHAWSNGSSFRSWLLNCCLPEAHSLNHDITGQQDSLHKSRSVNIGHIVHG